ncbi:hypothetical protein B0H14DRAFT_3444976 [Mycena olivaceomarginata]|nr:hypothetical protein B0H14DRAFT_3444976 [Mycena olivaceomarginata]
MIVKSEPQLATVPAPVPSAPLDTDPVMSLPSSTPTPRPDTEPLAIPAFGVCDFCDILLTIAPSAKLIQLTPKSHSVPTPANPNHRVALVSHQSTAYCKQHDTDARLLPTARANSWPEHINYAGLVLRVIDLEPTLQEILSDIHESEYFQTALASEPKKFTAYFGELGHEAISSAIRNLLPASKVSVDYAPLSYNAVMDQVLVPEVIVCFICEDLDISRDQASAVLEESTPFGLAYHSDTLDRDRCVEHARERGKGREEPAPVSSPTPTPTSTPTPTRPKESLTTLIPLLSPHALPPQLAPAAWSRSPNSDASDSGSRGPLRLL